MEWPLEIKSLEFILTGAKASCRPTTYQETLTKESIAYGNALTHQGFCSLRECIDFVVRNSGLTETDIVVFDKDNIIPLPDYLQYYDTSDDNDIDDTVVMNNTSMRTSQHHVNVLLNPVLTYVSSSMDNSPIAYIKQYCQYMHMALVGVQPESERRVLGSDTSAEITHLARKPIPYAFSLMLQVFKHFRILFMHIL